MNPAATIVDVLRQRARTEPDRIAFILLDDRGAETDRLSFGELLAQSLAVARQLSSDCVAGDRVLLVLPTSRQFLFALFGCFLARLVAVPLPVPKPRSASALATVWTDCRPRRVLATPSVLSMAGQDADLAALDLRRLATVDDLLGSDAQQPGRPEAFVPPASAETALLQYTSGSTSQPKGVVVSHANIMANQRMISEAFGHHQPITVVAWAPLYHDQGLIGNLLQPLFVGGCAVLMPPAAFFHDPLLWLDLIDRYRAHTSGGPNFAFQACVARYKPARAAAWDLSCWKVAFNGAEPVSASVLREFTERFAAHGFSAHSHFPCYGLAEATLFVSGGPAQRAPLTVIADDQRELVCLGQVHRGVELTVIDEHGHPRPDGQEGEICLRGPSVTQGYWNLPARAEPHFIRLDAGLPHLLTGDLGFVRDGDLYVTGRKKEVIILRGRNVYPYDIERSIAACHEGFRSGACAVFGHSDGDQPRVHAVQEIERTARGKLDFAQVAGVVRREVAQRHGVTLHRIHFVRPGFLPRTTSGKTRRLLLSSMLIQAPTEVEGVYASC